MAAALMWLRSGDVASLAAWLHNEPDAERAMSDPLYAESEETRRAEVFGDRAGVPLLHWAVEAENLEACALLLDKYVSLISAKDMEGATALHYAALNGDATTGTWLLKRFHECGPYEDKPQNLVSVVDSRAESALHCAALNGHLDMARVLLQHGADVNAKSLSGDTPLHVAVRNGHRSVCALLLSDPRCDPAIPDAQKKTALDLAEARGDRGLIDCFDTSRRETLMNVDSLTAEVAKLRSEIAELKAQHERDQSAIAQAYKRLRAEEEAHAATKLKLEQLENNGGAPLQNTEQSTANTSESAPAPLESQLSDSERTRLRTLEQQARLWAQREDEAVMRRLVAESRLRDVHRSLSNLMSLFDTTQVAIVSAKNDLEAMRPYLAGTDFPADSLPAVKAEGGEYDIVPEAAKNPPWLIQ